MEVNKETYEEIRKNSGLDDETLDLIEDYVKMKIGLIEDAVDGLVLEEDEMETVKHLLETQDSTTIRNICKIIRKAKVYKL